jgi:hypothetical protein
MTLPLTIIARGRAIARPLVFPVSRRQYFAPLLYYPSYSVFIIGILSCRSIVVKWQLEILQRKLTTDD